MKTGFHRFAAFFGIGCAIVFALTPLLAGADAGPMFGRRPTAATPPPIATPAPSHLPAKRTIHGSKGDDGGCHDGNMRTDSAPSTSYHPSHLNSVVPSTSESLVAI
jgi:hypothetical protein